MEYADEWILFPENIDPHLAINESSLSNGELYTSAINTNRDLHTRKESLVAAVAETKSEDVIQVLKQIDGKACKAMAKVTLDLADSMYRIVTITFPKAKRVIGRFHIQKLACDAV